MEGRKCVVGAVHWSDELQRALEREIEAGRASSVAEFVEDAAWLLMEDAVLDDPEIAQAALAGIADSEAGRYTTIDTPDDARRFHAEAMERALRRLGNVD